MPHHLEGVRNFCALHGALQLFEAMDGVVPVVHSTAGCGVQYHLGVTRQSGGSGPFGSPPVSSSNISEKHVVFGGGSRLREQLKNTVKVVKGDLYAIVTGCAAEMVGDDIPAMAKEGKEQGWPVVYANTPGFGGDVHHGYQVAVRALLEQLPELAASETAPVENLVNIWGVIPNSDPFWRGNLQELHRVLSGAGLTANLLLGDGQGVQAWRQIPGARLNLSVSPWGEEAVRLLEERYGTPYLSVPALPVGFATGKFLRAVLAALGRDNDEAAESFIAREEAVLNRHFARMADSYFRHGFQREFALVGESAQVIGLAGFLSGQLGLVPGTLAVTDPLPEPSRREVEQHVGAITKGAATVVFSEDQAEITDALGTGSPGIVVGSSLERAAAASLGIPLVEASFPIGSRLILDRCYSGYRGAVTVLEDVGSAMVAGSPRETDVTAQ